MADQNTQFYAILTNVGAAKQANADALGVPWKITQMGVGDANGTEPTPNATQTRLINEWRRAPLNQLKVDDKNNAIIVAEQVIPAEVGGKWIREIALYDADGDMIAVANCPPTFKPLLSQGSGRTQVVRMNLLVSSSSNVELKIDPAVVLATREYVDTVVVEALSKLDYKHSVVVATTGNIVLSGIQTIDGELLPDGARVLVKDQNQGKDNGIYIALASGPWKRAPDADANAKVTPGLFVSVEKGTTNGDSCWQLVTDAPIVLSTTALVFEMVAGRTGVNAGTYRAVTVDKYGRVVGGTNPTSLSEYGIATATKDQAEAGTDNSAPMTALRVFQGIPKALQQIFAAGQSTSQAAGYQKFPGGLILQWGVFSYTAAGTQALSIPLPIAFPNMILSASVTTPSRLNNTAVGADPVYTSTKSTLSLSSITSSDSGPMTIFYTVWGI
ncbi:phage tail protein [Pseudomonas mosselii]|uniref:phage tail protein n=1 Tax=Pseudomonas mosselii TaxID=78327 RepID=UPI003D76680C